MAFLAKDLSVISYANGFTLWHYASQDSQQTIVATNYFVAANDMLRNGDMILVNSDIAGTIGCQMLAVSKVSKSNVEVALFASTS